MSIELWLAFVAASAILLIIPGPTILTVISYSMAHGRRANVPLVAAVALGDSTALVVSLLGLGALLATSAFWFTVVKWAGGLYLIYLGVKLFRAGISSTPRSTRGSMRCLPLQRGSSWHPRRRSGVSIFQAGRCFRLQVCGHCLPSAPGEEWPVPALWAGDGHQQMGLV